MVSWFGASVVACKLLYMTKDGQTGHESFQEKMNRPDQLNRIVTVMYGLNNFGVTPNAVKHIQKSYYRDVSPETLLQYLSHCVATLQNQRDLAAGVLGIDKSAFGSLDFSIVNENPQEVDEDQSDDYYNDVDQEVDDEEDDDDQPIQTITNWED